MKKSVDLLNEMGVQSKDNLNSLIIDTDKIKHIVNDKLNSDPYERKIYMKKKIFSGILVAAVIFTITSLSVLAATFNWHEKLIEYFNPTAQQMEELQGNVAMPQATATDNGVTVNVLNTIVDSHDIYTLYEVLLPESITITKEIAESDLQWDFDFLDYKAEETKDVCGMSGTSRKLLDFSEHKMTFLMYDSTEQKTLNNQDITLNLENLVYYTHTENDIIKTTLINCDLSLSWKLNYENKTRTYNVNQKTVIYPGKDNRLSKVEVSPVSVWIQIEGDDTMMAAKPIIKFKDGTQIQFDARNDFNVSSDFANFIDGREGGIITFGYCFDKIHNMSDYESITVGDLTVPIK